MNLARTGNKYLTESEPWKTRKTDENIAANSIYVCLQIVAALSILFDPILPSKMALLRKQIGLNNVNWSDIKKAMLTSGSAILSGDILFAKIEDEIIEKQIQKLHLSDTIENAVVHFEAIAQEIEFDQFISNDLRTGVITSAENIPKSKKLLKLQVDIGIENRQILSGIAEYFKPEDVIGKKVIIVANLKERMMMGMPSQGMILMANNPDGSLSFITSDGAPGSRIS
jgi:methionyl-tRNA synthetase